MPHLLSLQGIRDILERLRMRIQEAQKHIDPTDPDADSEHWYRTLTSFFEDKKSKRSYITVIKVFLAIFAWYWKDPDSCLWLTNPDADPGGPKTWYGSPTLLTLL